MNKLLVHAVTSFIITAGGAIATSAMAGELNAMVLYAAMATGLVMAAKDVQSRMAAPPPVKK